MSGIKVEGENAQVDPMKEVLEKVNQMPIDDVLRLYERFLLEDGDKKHAESVHNLKIKLRGILPNAKYRVVKEMLAMGNLGKGDAQGLGMETRFAEKSEFIEFFQKLFPKA